jgi:hypothetical protein
VADNALSRLIYKSLLHKNRPKLSARSYAYREDLTAHDAIQFIQSEFLRRERLFIAEYDFSQYFESINHDFMRRTLWDERFLMTEVEQSIVESFLTAPKPAAVDGYKERGQAPRERGIPLGTSISLFLANVAASTLDRALEQLGVGFVRYADDTLIWSPDYAAICRAVDELYEAANRMGANLNPEKSSGIRVLVGPDTRAEIERADHIDFVGYRATLRTLEMKSSTVDRIKDHVGRLIYFNLIHEPANRRQNPARLGRVDRDYVTLIWQIRRYMYGDLSEKELRAFDKRGTPLRKFKGLMSYYPLVDDTPQLRGLDAWLLTQIWLGLRKRGQLLQVGGITSLPPPHGLSRAELAKYQYRSRTTGGLLDLRVPSFRRIASVVRRAARRYGPNAVGQAPIPYGY